MIGLRTSFHQKLKNRFLWFMGRVLFLFIPYILTGCYAGSSSIQITPTSEFAAIYPTVESETHQSTSLPPGQSNITATPISTLDTSTSIYHHPDGLFSLLAPDNWIVDRSDNGLIFTDPQGESTIHVLAVNTGYTLDEDAFHRFIESLESNGLTSNDNFLTINHQNEETGNSILITRELINQGEQKSMATYYQQQGPTIFIMELLTNSDIFDAYKELLTSIFDSSSVNIEDVLNLEMYSPQLGEDYIDEYVSIKFPPYWKINHTSSENSVVNTISSPDERAIIQIIIYDDGEYLSKVVAGRLVRTILREQYAKDINIYSDTVMPDGRERLAWNSNRSNYQGISFFETRDTTLLMVTMMWDNEYSGYYQPILEEIINTYTLQSPEGN